jgi:hypothetical protein
LGNATPAAILAAIVATIAKVFHRGVHFFGTWRNSYIAFSILFGFAYFYATGYDAGMN